MSQYPTSYVYFTFVGEEFDINEVTRILNISPTSTRKKKNPVPVNSAWTYRVDAEHNVDIITCLNKLVDLFESKADLICQIKKSLNLITRVQFVIYIDENPDVSTPYFPFDNRIVDFLYSTQSVVDFDIYRFNSTA